MQTLFSRLTIKQYPYPLVLKVGDVNFSGRGACKVEVPPKFQVYPPPGQIVRGDRGVVHVDCHPVLVRAASVLRLALLYHGSPVSPVTRPRSFNFIFFCSENCCGLMEKLICPFIANNFTQGGGSGDMSSGKRCKTANCLQLFNVRTSAGSRYKNCKYPLLLLAGYFREYSTM